MGRLQYLERLALGRSAFQPAPIGTDDQGNERQENSNDITTIPNDTGSGIQQYNLKGRPINPETEAQDARLRHASNEVLALVGVVERKESADARIQMDITLKRALREHLLTREDNRGQEWGALADVVAWFALWWPTALVRRIQIGIYSTGLPFTEILSREAHSVFGHGWRGVLLGLLPGTGIAILHKVIWQVLALIVEESVSALQNKIIASRFRRRSTKRIIRSLTIFVDIALVAIDVLLLPLEAYAFACQLQIAPPTPWRPLLTTHLPAFTRTAYHTTFASPASFLASPAPYLIGYSFLTRDASPEAPAFSDVTSYRLPPVSEPISTHTAPPKSPLLDPFGTILYHTWSLRQRFLHLVGWNVYETQHPGATHGWETDIHYESPDEFYDLGVVSHRSTALARLPATWLGMRVDMFLVRILLLPVEGLVMQKLARSYISSGMPLTEAALQAGVGDTIPNPLGLLVSGTVRSGWRGMMEKVSDLGLNQVGLGMAVNLGVEAALFGCLYVLVRRQGIQTFEWGKARDTDRQVESGQE